jgi:hypothetical protein
MKCAGVAGQVVAPAGHGQVAPEAVAAARVGDGDGVAAVRQKMGGRWCSAATGTAATKAGSDGGAVAIGRPRLGRMASRDARS